MDENILELSLADARERLGAHQLNHVMISFDEEKAIIGESLIKDGCTIVDGKRTNRISKFFNCTDCHILSREFNNPGANSPEDRLQFAIANNLPLLQGSTFWGIYNRNKYFNDDYFKKYGDGINQARDTLQNAIQFCAKYCASGRELQDWELESIMHYFKKHELRIKDLNLGNELINSVVRYDSLNEIEKKKALALLDSSYTLQYGATFVDPIPIEERSYGLNGDPFKGKVLFTKSCLYCHRDNRVSRFYFDDSKLASKWFWLKMNKESKKSLYVIVRKGTDGHNGKNRYMPLYTLEKLSNNQIEDIVAFIRTNAGK